MVKKQTSGQQKRSKKTEEALLRALDKLLTKKSFIELSVSEIATEAGLTTGAIYRRFESKDALLAAAIERGANRTQGIGRDKRELFAPDLTDSQLVKNLMNELFHLTFNNIYIMRAANYVIDPKALKALAAGRNDTAEWFSTLLKTTPQTGDGLKHQCRFIFRIVIAAYLDTLLSGIPTEVDRDTYLKTHKHKIDQLISDLHIMSCRYLEIPL